MESGVSVDEAHCADDNGEESETSGREEGGFVAVALELEGGYYVEA